MRTLLVGLLLIGFVGCGTLNRIDSENFKKRFDREREQPNVPDNPNEIYNV